VASFLAGFSPSARGLVFGVADWTLRGFRSAGREASRFFRVVWWWLGGRRGMSIL
jgi:hypothetical protein